MTVISHLEKIPVNGSRPAVDVKCRLTSGPTGFSRAIITACFAMRILLPALVESEASESGPKYVMASMPGF